uniref:RsmE family RNA methyltransferase n=1 Tax=Congregibacter sp. TaxID=2744308 RepID=UPI003F6C0597
ILHPEAHRNPLPDNCKSLTLLVGPEGGFSDEEVTAAVDQGFCALQMGPRILRTETAPLVGLALAQGRWGDISL